jgi:hypothetical protein
MYRLPLKRIDVNRRASAVSFTKRVSNPLVFQGLPFAHSPRALCTAAASCFGFTGFRITRQMPAAFSCSAEGLPRGPVESTTGKPGRIRLNRWASSSPVMPAVPWSRIAESKRSGSFENTRNAVRPSVSAVMLQPRRSSMAVVVLSTSLSCSTNKICGRCPESMRRPVFVGVAGRAPLSPSGVESGSSG